MAARTARWLAAVALVALSACAGPEKHERLAQRAVLEKLEADRRAIQRLVLAPSPAAPEMQWELYHKDLGSAAAAGAGQGALAGAGLPIIGGITVVLLPLTVPIGAVLGTVYGAASAVPEDKAAEVEGPVKAAAAGMQVQKDFAAVLARTLAQETAYPLSLPDEVGLAGGAAGTGRVETQVEKIGFERGLGREPKIAFYAYGKVRLLHPLGTKLIETDVGCRSEAVPAQDWAKDGGRLLRQEVERCYTRMARQFVIGKLVLAAFLKEGNPDCVLKVEQLPTLNHWNGANVATLQPTLRWEAFPRRIDRESGYAALIADVTDVVYDLRVWEGLAYETGPKPLVYAKDGLTSPEHTLEEPLRPGTSYHFSVRARFRLDGQPRTTFWSRYLDCGELHTGVGEEEAAYHHGFYRLRTP